MPSVPAALEAAIVRFVMTLPPRLQRWLTRGGKVIEGERIAPELQLMLALQRLGRVPDIGTVSLDRSRRDIDRQSVAVGGRQLVGAVRDLEVDGAEGPLRARLYTPTERLGADTSPTLMFIHGGGWFSGGLESHEQPCRVLAERSGVQVLAIDYRLAPEHPFPAAVHDSLAAYRWLVAHAAEVGADPQRLGVGGDSAGGNLSAVTALHAAEEGLPLAFQLLIYPGTDFTEESASRRAFQDHGLVLTRSFIDAAKAHYVPRIADREHPDASPLRRPELPDGLAAAHVVTAALDPLRDEGEAYAERLRAHGTKVELVREQGMVHGFLNVTGAGHESPAAIHRMADALRAGLS